MSSSIEKAEVKICRATIEQGASKGTRCSRPDSGNGYCGKHFKQAILTTYDKTTHQKCSHTRCNTIIPLTPGRYVYCEPCQKTRDEERAKLKLCKGADGVKCPFEASESGYCGKHEPRGLLLEQAAVQGVRICGDGKLPCKNILTNGRSHCEECLAKERIKDSARYANRVNDVSACLGCGCEISSYITGLDGSPVKRCQPCYNKLREVEDKRERVRNYAEERRKNIPIHYANCKRSAVMRNLPFALSIEEYETIITSSCKYCGHKDDNEAIGVDRINSLRGYDMTNVVPCCKICNMMKNDLSIDVFLSHALKIYKHSQLQNTRLTTEHTTAKESTSYIRPSLVADYYSKKKMEEYIALCEKDNRNSRYIQRMRESIQMKMTKPEFIKYVKDSLKTEINRKQELEYTRKIIDEKPRQRVSHKDFFTFFENGTPELVLHQYESIHGKAEGLKEDLMFLFRDWKTFSMQEKNDKFKEILVKYKNKKHYEAMKVLKAQTQPSPLQHQPPL